MHVYIVTSSATDTDSSGVIHETRTRCYGVFTSESVADSVAVKFGATVKSLVLDVEHPYQDSVVLQNWINPGYVS